MKTNKINIAVLITCHNRKLTTYSCIKNLLKTKKKNIKLKIYLVDDGSTDNTTFFLKKKKIPHLKIIKGNGNLFWCGGTNLAWQNANKDNIIFDYYLWLNDDTNIFSNSINMLLKVEKIYKTKKFICVGSCYSNSNDKTRSYGGAVNLKSKIRIFKNKPLKPTLKYQKINRFNGNIVMISKKAFETVGYINPKLKHYFGDMDYAIKSERYKISTFLAPNFLGQCYNDSNKLKKNFKFKFVKLKDGFSFCKENGGLFWFLHFVSFLKRIVFE